MIEKDWENKAWDMIYEHRRMEEAIQYLSQIIRKMPQNDQAYAIMANLLNQLAKDTKNWDYSIEALKYAERAIEINPHNETALFNKAWSLIDLGKPREALEYAKRALKVAPRNVYAWYNKAWAHFLLDEAEKALECCNRIIEIDLNFADWAKELKNRIKNREIPEHLAKFRKERG